MSGAATDIDPVLDRGDTRILQYTATGLLVPAEEPLTHQSGAIGGGPGLAFAREYLKSLPTGDTVVLVPAAYSGVGFSTPDMGGGNRSWKVSHSPSADNVYKSSLTQIYGALEAIKGKKQIDGALINVGGTDAQNGVGPAEYQRDLDALIAAYRQQLNIPQLPFVLGPSRPDIVGNDPSYAAINRVQQTTPQRVKNTAFILGSTGEQYYIPGDVLHYNMLAHREMGVYYAEALLRLQHRFKNS